MIDYNLFTIYEEVNKLFGSELADLEWLFPYVYTKLLDFQV